MTTTTNPEVKQTQTLMDYDILTPHNVIKCDQTMFLGYIGEIMNVLQSHHSSKYVLN